MEINKFLAGIRIYKNQAISMFLRFFYSGISHVLGQRIDKPRKLSALSPSREGYLLNIVRKQFFPSYLEYEMAARGGELCAAPTRPRISRRYTNKQRKRGRQAER